MTDILLTNDDGYNSVGFYPLLKELTKHFSVTAVAPSSEQSWIGKSISKSSALSLTKVKLNEFEIFSLNGTPADCVQVGLYDVISEKPKLVVSGINTGLNTGHGRILSSGTIGASMEASIDGVKSISVSIHIPEGINNSDVDEIVFQNAAIITTNIIKLFIDKPLGENIDLISINIPFSARIDAEIEVTRPHRDPYGKLFHKTDDRYNHISPPIDFSIAKAGTDLRALAEEKISITPISLELVSEKAMEQMKKMLNDKK
ncbi:MAG: 5'/3'-nucleotidase SurE [Candidatus Gracilibacteria bacterium]